ncbi:MULTISPECIES: hypothetical protein [unclassified Burkholderia]|uniref:hypothetical protein n=1 Tax=unclassified Burkholderia TaxID=2613784 RepID=UPI000F5803FB|nr:MULTISPECIES: hypothetical protein [unclassified Burkholderia]
MTLLAVKEAWSVRGLREAGVQRWAVRGGDAGLGLFHERLGFSGRPRSALLRRSMVQCRQLDVVSHTSFQGLFDGSALIERTWSEVQRRFGHSRLPFGRAFSVSAPRCAAAPDCSGIKTASWASLAK